MKFKWNEDMTSKIISGSIVCIIAITFYFIVKNLGGIFSVISNITKVLSPFVIGFIIAYLLTRPVNALEGLLNKFLFKKWKKQATINRGVSITVVILLMLILLALLIYSVVPQLVDSVTRLANNADGYIKSINAMLDKLFAHFHIDASFFENFLGSSQEIFKKMTKYIAAGIPKVLDFSVSIGSGISNSLIGFIVSIYMLSGKERFSAQLKKGLFAIFPKKVADEIIETGCDINETFGKYFSGQILDCAALGVICFIIMSILNMEYALLISMIIMITNFIPFIGPFIGAVPSAFILLMVQPGKVIWFIIMVFVLQQIEGNILAPKIVGKTTGLSSFWVIFAIIVGGGFFGVGGVILAVPTFSLIYTFAKRFLERRLKNEGLGENTTEYYKK